MKSSILGLALLLATAFAGAHQFVIGSITIGHPSSRVTAPSQPVGAGYMKFVNSGADDRLVSASTPVAAAVELHSMRLEGDIMRMREIDAIDVPAGKTVELKPGGVHLMLVGLKAPLVLNQHFPLKLRFERAGEVTVDVKVEAAGPAAEHREH